MIAEYNCINRRLYMDIEKLENFLIFADCMNFTAAANKAFLDTSVFYRQISSVENELNVQLINRDSRAMSLTPAGEAFAKGMRKVVELYHTEIEKVIGLDSGNSGIIRICNVFNHSIEPGLASAISNFEALHPDIKVIILSKAMGESISMLQKGDVDFNIFRAYDYACIDDVETLTITKINAGFAVHTDLLPEICRDEESFREDMLDGYPLILCDELLSTSSKAYIQERKERLGKDSVIFVDNRESTYTYVELKKGFTIINDICYFRFQPGIRYFASKRFPPHDQSINRKISSDNPSAELMWDYLCKCFLPKNC